MLRSNQREDLIDLRFANSSILFYLNRDNALVQSIYMYFNYANGFADLSKKEIKVKEKAIYPLQ